MEYMRLPEGTEEATIDGENWINSRLCSVRYAVTKSDRPRGRRKKNTALDGRRLAHRDFLVGTRVLPFYLESDMMAITTARATDIQVIEDDDGRWLWERLVARRLEISTQTVHCDEWLLPNGGVFLPRTRRERVWGSNGRAQLYDRRFLLEEDVEQYERLIQEALAYSPNDSNWLIVGDAAREFKVSKQKIDRWARLRQWKLEGRTLRHEKFPGPLVGRGDGMVGMVLHYYRPDLERMTDTSMPDYPVYRDADGEWLPVQSARKKYGFNKTALSYWHENACRWLGGRTLRAKLVAPFTGASGPDGKVAIYHDDDLQQIHQVRKKRRPPTRHRVDEP